MATPTSRAQELITCDFCRTPARHFCNSCQVRLCVNCVSKHVDNPRPQRHDIVHFTNRKIQPVFPECKCHPNQSCDAHCQQCNVNVCLKCILSSHNGHKIKEMLTIFNEKSREIEKENIEIESAIIPKYNKKLKDTESEISKAKFKFEELEKIKEKHRKQWHQEVDSIFNKLGSLMMSMKEDFLTTLKSHQSKLENLISDMIQTLAQNKDILKTNKVSEVSDYKSKLKEYRDIPTDIDVKTPSMYTRTDQGKELGIELGEYQATLTQSEISSLTDEVSFLSMRELLDKARVIATIPTAVVPLWRVACGKTDDAWVSGADKLIIRIDMHGSRQESVYTRCLYCPGGISLTKQGELIYSDHGNKSVNIVRGGRIEILFTPPDDWIPWGVCCTRSGDILVNVYRNSKNKIICYDGITMNTMKEIAEDEQGNQIFKNGRFSLFLVENVNGDICVSDPNAKILLVLDKRGRVKFRYDGTPAARQKKLFNPTQIATDSMRQIIVIDFNNSCLHILDQNGQFLRCVDNCGLCKPIGLSVDIEGRLWVGLHDTGEVKIIQYMI
ncbi:uncharacterized protein LOC134245599 [Saccostrea cucullata]|uniref:uncharacterized protein LOC134245599 n=1 Tax=Saccostrea cuccullata TaxID=36930 RepID=UPI002ED13C31